MKRILALVAVAAIAFGIVGAAAATLGGTLTPQHLAANSATVTGCGANLGNITATFGTDYDTVTNKFTITTITLKGATPADSDFTGCDDGVTLRLNGLQDGEVTAFDKIEVLSSDGAHPYKDLLVLTLESAWPDVSTIDRLAIMVKN